MNLTQHRVQVVRAEVADRATLVRLLQLYLYDFSAFAKADEPCGDVGEDGSFAYDHFESYWSNDRREPLLLRSDCQLVGFALINDWSASGCAVDYCMAEFFVLRKYRRAGIGASAAHEIIAQRPGVWEVPVVHYNKPALSFWRSVTASTPGQAIKEVAGDGIRWSGMILRIVPNLTPL